MNFKILGCLLSISIHWGCTSTKVIKLSPAEGPSKEFGSRSHFAEAIHADANQASFARSLGLDSYVVSRFNYYPSSYTVFRSRIPAYAGDSMVNKQNNAQMLKGTSEEFPFENFNTEILFLLGRKNDGKYLVVADQNNNKSFADDSIYVFEKINENINVGSERLKVLPQVKIKNVKSYFNKKIHTFSHSLLIEPVLLSEENEHETRKELHLNVASVEYNKGVFKYKGESYQVAARNTLLPYLYFDPRAIKVKFADADDTSAFQKTSNRPPTYYIGDTVLLGNRKFCIEKVSPLLNKINIKMLK